MVISKKIRIGYYIFKVDVRPKPANINEDTECYEILWYFGYDKSNVMEIVLWRKLGLFRNDEAFQLLIMLICAFLKLIGKGRLCTRKYLCEYDDSVKIICICPHCGNKMKCMIFSHFHRCSVCSRRFISK